MNIIGVVRSFEGVSLDAEGRAILVGDRLIGRVDEAGQVCSMKLLVHPLDLEPLTEEYPFVMPAGNGWVEVMIGDEADGEQLSAVMECLGSAVDRAQEPL